MEGNYIGLFVQDMDVVMTRAARSHVEFNFLCNLSCTVFRNEEEDVVKLNLSSRWFDKIKFSSWFSSSLYTAAGLEMETSKVESVVRNQAEAKLNQLEHSEPVGTIRTSCKR
ncbi:pentatricopeptide repeat-containing protein mitochondrial-like [Dorcoceras hygrometricum]|uniref:Pentatricopeptide repeat-containing protein mitochondrial-like n=1 Tax=Dorcoceras hygrometricum TaxID=472368 RepID=A0A2Z7AED2_9LAMI|nr:pentatricopeptide repeat-containing protein mitochondrial-like [Dorcoceras hygrometricum]